MQVTARFFAILKDRAGVAELILELPAGATVTSAIELIVKQFPAIQSDLKRAAFAVNRNYTNTDLVLSDGDELALIPPVSGG
ncbi:MAG TPA: molybdopterin converting factor subunit 1 [Tepidisphaeraceae bacterium]|nr:molybdopterin converting factor subunit 1 [Tepidisphaeraceae bacterium]